MNDIIWLVLRRLRPPLLVLISIYSIAVLGMVLVPGNEIGGEIVRMDFFQAFYFVSYTATTIGFGEVPQAFSNEQRMWALCCIYMSVVAWLYSIGSILGLMQDQAFRQALVERRFARSVSHINERFYLICGYGEAGAALVKVLTHYHIRVVVIDNDPDRINELSLQDQRLPVYVPGLCADANIPEHLLEAGLQHPSCTRVIALTSSDETNLKIAITSKLLNPKLKVVAWTSNAATKANMASFGTDEIVDAFEIFAETLALALHSPDQYLLQEWLSGISHAEFERPAVPPRGKWIVCGYGRFGQFLTEHLEREGLPTVVIEADPQVASLEQGVIVGAGTEAETLLEAGVEDAVGIIAGTDNDQNNLSIIMTAKQLNPKLFFVARQNHGANKSIFDAFDADIIVNPNLILANQIDNLVTTPRLAEFLRLARKKDNDWAHAVLSSFDDVIGTDIVPDIWMIRVTEKHAPAIFEVLSRGMNVTIQDLLMDPFLDSKALRAHPLLFSRDGQSEILPDIATTLQPGDCILYCGVQNAYPRMHVTINDYFHLIQITSGQQVPRSGLLRWVLGYDKQLKKLTE